MIVLSPVSANRPASDTGSSRRVARRFAAPLYSLEAGKKARIDRLR